MITAEDQKASPADVASVVEGQPFKQFELRFGGVECHAISPGNGSASEMPWLQANHVLLAVPLGEIEVHQTWGASNRGLAAQLSGGGCGDLQHGSHGLRQNGVFRFKVVNVSLI